METEFLYKKCELDVYAKYLEYIYEFGDFPDSKSEYFTIMYKYDVFKQWYESNVINDIYYNEIVDYFENKIGVCNFSFEEIVELHFINEFIRTNYYKLESIKDNLKIDNDFSLFVKNGINTFKRTVREFTMYVDDPKLDCYAEKLRMYYKEDTSNKFSIMQKINECISIMQILYKYQIIEFEDYGELMEIYQEILMDDSLKIYSGDIKRLFEVVDRITNNLIKIYNLEQKKKIK